MFKKKNKDSSEDAESDKGSRKVVTETVEKSGGVQTKTTTVTCTEKDLGAAFHKLGFDPHKFHSGGTRVTRQIVYTNSTGEREVLEETVETFDQTGDSVKKLLEKSNPSHAITHATAPEIQSSKETGLKASNVKPVKAGDFEKDSLKAHNEYRKLHGVPNLELSNELCGYSKEWADHLAATDSFQHRSEHKFGENIFMKWSSDPNHSVTGDEAVKSWYSEIKDHIFGQEPKSLKSGHFTQVVWKESKKLGVAWARSGSGKILVVANYDPPGNFIGTFAKNVPPPKK